MLRELWDPIDKYSCLLVDIIFLSKPIVTLLAGHILFQQQKYWQISDDLKDEICSLSMEALAQKLQNGELKAVDVLHAYQKKVSIYFLY